jgi:hypothetical protein
MTVEKAQVQVESTEQSAKRRKQSMTVRSSALFYASTSNGMNTEISFLNHFLLKREIPKVVCFASFRTMTGQLVKRVPIVVEQPIVYAMPVADHVGGDFEGSVEIEFYSVENIFVPYAAVSAIYSSAQSFCQIHSYTRIYNSMELEETHIIPTGEEAGWMLRDFEAGTESVAFLHNGP